jgi:hypothetical protein
VRVAIIKVYRDSAGIDCNASTRFRANASKSAPIREEKNAAQNIEFMCFVTGHYFSRAAHGRRMDGGHYRPRKNSSRGRKKRPATIFSLKAVLQEAPLFFFALPALFALQNKHILRALSPDVNVPEGKAGGRFRLTAKKY